MLIVYCIVSPFISIVAVKLNVSVVSTDGKVISALPSEASITAGMLPAVCSQVMVLASALIRVVLRFTESPELTVISDSLMVSVGTCPSQALLLTVSYCEKDRFSCSINGNIIYPPTVFCIVLVAG